MSAIVWIGLLWVLPLFVAVSMGKPKGREGWIYGLFGWLGVIALAVLPKNMSRGAFVECPHCKETVRYSATVCPHCQRDIAVPAA